MKTSVMIPFLIQHVLMGSFLSAQDPVPGRIQGLVLDDNTGVPVSRAIVYLDGGLQATTDPTGTFSFDGVPPGIYQIAAVGPECTTALGQVTVESDGETRVDFRIEVAVLEADRTGEGGREVSPGETGGWIKVFTVEEIRSSTASSLLELIKLSVPGMAGEMSGSSGEVGRLRLRGNNTATQSTEPILILDGARIQRRAGELLSQLSPDQVTRIEITRGSAGAWIHGHGSANGVIRVFTRSPDLAPPAPLDPEECGSPFRIRKGT